MRQRFKQDFLIGTALAFIILFIYLVSLCPSVYLIDSGELAAVSYTLGIAHPTGYPLYTIISYFFAHLPGEPVRNLNFLSALFSVMAAIFLYLTTKSILKNNWLPIMIASLYAFSPTIWRTSITNEVYPLTGLLIIMIFYAVYRLDNERVFYVIMYLIGLALTNHMVIFSLVLPLFVYLAMVYRPNLKKITWALCTMLFGMTIYFYLISRTLGGAELAWGNTYNVERLFWHMTGRQYQVWMFSLSATEVYSNLGKGLVFIIEDFLFIFVVPIFLGLYYLVKYERNKFWLLIAIVVLNIAYTINYSIPDIEPYYIPSLVALLLVFTYGLKLLVKYVKWFVVLPIALVIPLVNYHSCTLRNNTFGLDFSYAYIKELPQTSLLICSYWDIYAPTIYLRKVKNIRKDLIIIDKELLRRTWYLEYLKKEYPQFGQTVAKEIEEFETELYKFEYKKPYNPQIIQAKFIKMLDRFVDAKVSQGAYFAIPVPDQDLDAVKSSYYRIPRGLVFKLQSDTASSPFEFSELGIRKPKSMNDERLMFNVEIVRIMARNNIIYLNSAQRFNEAEKIKDWLKDF